jgi:chromosomal replication initiation ATPase DnaA
MIDIELYSKKAGLSAGDLKSKARITEIVIPRQVYWYYMKKHGFSYSEIGRMFKKNHATVMHGVKRVNDLIDAKDSYAERYLKILFEE